MTSHVVVNMIREERYASGEAAPYVFMIDVDHTEDPGSQMSAMGRIGPRRATDEQIAMIKDLSSGVLFRMRDGDGDLYYSGRIDFGTEDDNAKDWFAPLTDFGRPYAGCTSIEYFEYGKWVEV